MKFVGDYSLKMMCAHVVHNNIPISKRGSLPKELSEYEIKSMSRMLVYMETYTTTFQPAKKENPKVDAYFDSVKTVQISCHRCMMKIYTQNIGQTVWNLM